MVWFHQWLLMSIWVGMVVMDPPPPTTTTPPTTTVPTTTTAAPPPPCDCITAIRDAADDAKDLTIKQNDDYTVSSLIDLVVGSTNEIVQEKLNNFSFTTKHVTTSAATSTILDPLRCTLTTQYSSCANIKSNETNPKSCQYSIYPEGFPNGVNVWCDMDTDGGGWTRFQLRKDDTIQFNRTWADYKNGFGAPLCGNWIGNDVLNSLTTTATEIRIEMQDWRGSSRRAEYSSFSVGPESNNYTLTVTGYTGNAGNSLEYHSGKQFSTMGVDNDASATDCSAIHGGGWWFKSCLEANLNGGHFEAITSDPNGIIWKDWQGLLYSLMTTEMYLRPAGYQ